MAFKRPWFGCANAPAKTDENPSSNEHVDKVTPQPKSAPPATCPPLP
jgi:hypothetical protein